MRCKEEIIYCESGGAPTEDEVNSSLEGFKVQLDGTLINLV